MNDFKIKDISSSEIRSNMKNPRILKTYTIKKHNSSVVETFFFRT